VHVCCNNVFTRYALFTLLWGCQVGEAGLQANPTELVVTGGRVNLRHLREDVAFAAWRLRQHKATVHLPPELADLQPEVGGLGYVRTLARVFDVPQRNDKEGEGCKHAACMSRLPGMALPDYMLLQCIMRTKHRLHTTGVWRSSLAVAVHDAAFALAGVSAGSSCVVYPWCSAQPNDTQRICRPSHLQDATLCHITPAALPLIQATG
jgi:hypothetical protein